jgi:hypothetical protein
VSGYHATPANVRRAARDANRAVEPFVVAVEGDEGREVTSRGLTPYTDGFTVHAYVLTEVTQPPDGGLDVMKARWEEGFAAEAVFRQSNSDASLDQGPTGRLGHRTVESRAEEKGAAVDPHHHRYRAAGGRWQQESIRSGRKPMTLAYSMSA